MNLKHMLMKLTKANLMLKTNDPKRFEYKYGKFRGKCSCKTNLKIFNMKYQFSQKKINEYKNNGYLVSRNFFLKKKKLII